MSSSVNRSVDYVKVVDALADVVKELNRGAEGAAGAAAHAATDPDAQIADTAADTAANMAAGAAAERSSTESQYVNNADFLMRTDPMRVENNRQAHLNSIYTFELYEWRTTRKPTTVTFSRGLTIGELKQEVKRMFNLPFDVSLIGKQVWNNPEGRWFVLENDGQDLLSSNCFTHGWHVLWKMGRPAKWINTWPKHPNELDWENTGTFDLVENSNPSNTAVVVFSKYTTIGELREFIKKSRNLPRVDLSYNRVILNSDNVTLQQTFVSPPPKHQTRHTIHW
jgi:hypothetical protein